MLVKYNENGYATYIRHYACHNYLNQGKQINYFNTTSIP